MIVTQMRSRRITPGRRYAQTINLAISSLRQGA